VILSDAFRVFYRLLAAELDVRPEPKGAAELVLECIENFPAEDLSALAEAIALQASSGIESVNTVRLGVGESCPDFSEQAQVIDLRGLTAYPKFDSNVLVRADVVFIRTSTQPRLGGVAIKFDLTHKITFEAVTTVLSELLRT